MYRTFQLFNRFFFQEKMDGFVPAHLFGWWVKTLILRDYWMTFLLSILFEILEYTLQHQLPNFSECWWDHVCVLTRDKFTTLREENIHEFTPNSQK